MKQNKFLEISDEVSKAITEKKAVVALESTIISHGMPYPENVKTALEVEQTIRDNGAIPATIAIINGKIKVGLSKDEIEALGKADDVIKCSRRDFPFILSQKMMGATTVSGTMIVAGQVGIKVFATGGIGGVHRAASETFDISADLEELAKTDVAVVCAGVKSILDIGLTLEYLETKGVPVVGYQTNQFPAFYCRESGFQSTYSLETAKDIANFLNAKWEMNLKGGVVVANPIPENFSMDPKLINGAIDKALEECHQKNIIGKEITPFLLAKIKEITSGKSLTSNIALIHNNAKVAAEIASSM